MYPERSSGALSSESQSPDEADESGELQAAAAAAGTVAVNAGGGSSTRPQQPAAASGSGSGKRRYVGVRQRPSGRWVAEIKDTTHKIRLWLGTFNNPEDAARAYDDAARTLRGANTRTNFTRPLGTRPGFSSNSVRLLLQKAVEAAAVAGNLDSGGVRPSVAAAAAAGGGAAMDASSSVPSSFTAATSTSAPPQDPGPSNYYAGGFHSDSDSELEQAIRQQRANSSATGNLFGQANPRHGIISRSVSYDHATMMRSQLEAAAAAAAAGSNPHLRLYSSFSGDLSGSQAAAPSGSFDLQQMQISNAGQLQGSSGYEASLDQADRGTQQGSSSASYSSRPRYHPQSNIYESLREKLGYGHGTAHQSHFALSGREGTTTFATTGADGVDNMDLGWDPDPSVQSGGNLIQHWGTGRSTDVLSRVHDQPTGADHVQASHESWDHGNVASRGHDAAAAAADHERFGLEEIPTVNWGDLGTSSTATGTGDAADIHHERMDTMSPLNWEDLGRTLTPSSSSEQRVRPVGRPTTINWGDLISRNSAAGEAQRMKGITNNSASWGGNVNMHMDRGHGGGMDFPAQGLGFAAPNSWTPLPPSSSQEYWEAAAGQPQMPTGVAHLQASHQDQQLLHIQNVDKSGSQPAVPWATSSGQPQYVHTAFPNVQQQQEQRSSTLVETATREPSVSGQDSGSAGEDIDLPTGTQQQGISNSPDYTAIDPSNRDAGSMSRFLSHNQADQADSGLNFLMLSPGFFRMDSFQRREPPTPTNIATGTDDIHAAQQDADLISTAVAMEARHDQDSRSLQPLITGSPLPEVQPTVSDPSLADRGTGLVRPKLHRNNAACLPEVIRDGVDDRDERSLTPTRSHMLGEAVRSHLVLGGSVITTQDLVAATRSASDSDVTHASDAPFRHALSRGLSDDREAFEAIKQVGKHVGTSRSM